MWKVLLPGEKLTKSVEVVGAVIFREGKILCAKRGSEGLLPGLWEFPGGKVEPAESKREALAREIREELESEIEVGAEIECTTYDYDFATVTLTTFSCALVSGEPQKSEHSELRWLEPRELSTIEWAPADIPAVARIQEGRLLT